jgi:tRNA-Thr(GGU) m(6)t(6)A37 methyltransferase TsaA
MRRLLASRRFAPRRSRPPARATLDVIGYVTNSVTTPRPHGWESVESQIQLVQPAVGEMLLGLDGYSHVLVIFWIDRLGEDRPRPRTLRPGGETAPIQGILATRSQLRPTPLGLSAVPLLEIDSASLRVRGLDAIDGTPVLDLKPYIPHYDSVPSARVPAWVLGDDD